MYNVQYNFGRLTKSVIVNW